MTIDPLLARLSMASLPDLRELSRDLKLELRDAKQASRGDLERQLAREFRSVAGHSVMNGIRALRRKDLSFREILIDVADILTPGQFKRSGFHKEPMCSELEIEEYIEARVRELVLKKLAGMPEHERARLQSEVEADLRAKGMPDAALQAAAVGVSAAALAGMALGPAMAAALYSTMWSFLVGLGLRQVLLGAVAAGGPIGAALAVGMAVTMPSRRKTVPAVVRLIMIRRSHEQRSELMKEC